MVKKVVKKRKLKVFNFLLLLIGLGVVVFAGYFYCQLPIKNIVIKNTNYINDDEIINLAGIKDYPSFILSSTKKMSRNIESSPYVIKASVKRSWYHVIKIDITENEPLFYNQVEKKIVFSDKQSVEVTDESLFRVPRLLNYVPDNKYSSFIKGMKNIDEDTLSKISDIEYSPNDYDKERFLLYMDDGNMVYLTLTKFKQINYYNEVLSQLEYKKGILYLDNGNHFQIRE